MTHEHQIQRVIDVIQNESPEHLRDPNYLEFRLLPSLGLNDRHMHQYPDHLHKHCGRGIDSWQYPNQFSRYLVYLSDHDITSYAEIGCHKGGTFIITVEYLRRFAQFQRGLAIDPWPRQIMHDYCGVRPEITYVTQHSQHPDSVKLLTSHHWDLTLIDGDHSYAGVRQDFDLVHEHSNFVALHDIRNVLCPGTQQMWDDIKKTHSPDQLHEWCAQYDQVLLRMRGSVMGLGLVDLR